MRNLLEDNTHEGKRFKGLEITFTLFLPHEICKQAMKHVSFGNRSTN